MPLLRSRSVISALMLSTALVVAGCEDAQDRAERYYQSALTLMEEGDQERALIELRNVFEFDGFHQEARQLYADTLLERGDNQEAYGQYLRLIEQYPDTPDVRVTLAEVAISRNDWDEAERHGRAAAELLPDDPRAGAIVAALDFRLAAIANDAEGQALALASAQEMLKSDPTNMVARRMVIASLLSGRTPTAALPDIDIAIEQAPELIEFHIAKFRVLVEAGREDEAGAQLEDMYARFPDNEEVRGTLISWTVRMGDTERTESLLREIAGPDDGPPEGHATVVRYLQNTAGTEAARAELDRLVEINEGTENADLYRAMLASLTFDAGQSDAAITQMQTIIEGAEESDQTRRLKTTLAQMLIATGDQVGARALVEDVIEGDGANVEALRMRAAWKIQDDDPDGAITDLRTALNQAPRNAPLLTLMAQAHQRAGQPELAGERLSLAFEVSNSAPDEALRYARYLNANDQPQAARATLTQSRRLHPTDIRLLTALADIFLAEENWTEVANIQAVLRQVNTEDSVGLANNLQNAVLTSQNRLDESIAFIENNITDADSADAAKITVILSLLRADRAEEARDFLAEALAETPDEPSLRMLNGSLQALDGNVEEAETAFRGVVDEFPGVTNPVRLLYNLLSAQGRDADAFAVINEALTAAPNNGELLWIKASILEQGDDFDGAIEIYEQLYALDTSNVIIANNLASMLATHRDDDESLERAFAVARRLNGIEVPALQDTYGWILSRRGQHREALESLEPAAAGLPEDPLVQYHLGMTYAALSQRDAAVEALSRAIELGQGRDLPQMAIAQETLTELVAQ